MSAASHPPITLVDYERLFRVIHGVLNFATQDPAKESLFFAVAGAFTLKRHHKLNSVSPVVGSEQGGVRPVLIVQNDIGNKFSPTVIAAAITSQRDKTNLPTHIEVDAGHCGLAKDSVVLLEQVRTIDKRRLREKMGALDGGDMGKVNEALSVSFGL